MGIQDSPYVRELERRYETNLSQGLSATAVLTKRASNGLNIVQKTYVRTWWRLLYEQCEQPLIVILFLATCFIFKFGESFDAYVTMVALLFNVCLGAFQEYKISRMVRTLSAQKEVDVLTLRDGNKTMVSTISLVQGDIIFVHEGEKIPADACVIEAYRFSVDESLVTGESFPVSYYVCEKERHEKDGCCVQAGAFVVSGFAKLVITETGKKTKLGKTHAFVDAGALSYPVEHELAHFLQTILSAIIIICIVFVCIGLYAGKPFTQLFSTIIALFMCVVPQGLPVIMTVVLASNASFLKKKGLLIKKLTALETLGKIDCLVVDKTGTLTSNEQAIVSLYVDDVEYKVTGKGYNKEGSVFLNGSKIGAEQCTKGLVEIATAGILLNYSEIVKDAETGHLFVKGDPWQAAMNICAHKLGFSKKTFENCYKELYIIPYSERNNYYVGFYERNDGSGILFAVGKVAALLPHCVSFSDSVVASATTYSDQGLRVYGVATKEFSLQELKDLLKNTNPEQHSAVWDALAAEHLVYSGMCTISDTLREDAKKNITALKDAGIRIIMATGDIPAIAKMIAQEVGIETQVVAQGSFLQEKTDSMIVNQATVWSGMSPLHKVQLIHALEKKGHIVAMVGDGGNDAPALKVAHVGIAMGKVGSESAKEAAHFILKNDSLGTIAVGIMQGRHCIDAFKRIMIYFFTTNVAEIVIMIVAFIGNGELPLLAPHIVWLNLASDGFLDTTLAFEPHGVHLKKLYHYQSQKRITISLVLVVLYQAFLIAGIAFGFFHYYASHGSLQLARTMALALMSMCQWAVALNCRSLRQSLFTIGFFSNPFLTYVMIAIPLCLFSIIQIPFFNPLFKTVPLSYVQWLIIVGLSSALIVIDEIRKLAVAFLWTEDKLVDE